MKLHVPSSLFCIPGALLATGVFSGCIGRSPMQEPTAPPVPPFVTDKDKGQDTAKPAPTAQSDVAVTARATQATFEAGKPVELRLTAQNTSQKSVELRFSSGQSFDFQAFKPASNEPVWTWSMDKMFVQMLREKRLAPGEKLEFEAQWENAPKGRYEIVGTLTANGGINADRFTVEVK